MTRSKFTPALAATVLVLAGAVACAQTQQDSIHDVSWLPMTEKEVKALKLESKKIHDLPLPFTPYDTMMPKIRERVEIFGDRIEYLADDPVGQFMVYMIGEDTANPNARLNIAVMNEAGKAVATKTLAPVAEPKTVFLLELSALPPGKYRVTAQLEGVAVRHRIPDYVFGKSAESRRVIEFPGRGVPLTVHAQSHLPDGAWPITTGIPLPRHVTSDVGLFQIWDNRGPVPAQFKVRSTWYPDREIKWLGVDFVAQYQQGRSADYRLVLMPENRLQWPVTPQTPLKVEAVDGAYVVNTGAIQFKVGRDRFAGIEEVRLVKADGTLSAPVVSGEGGPFLIDERGFDYSASNDYRTQVKIEEAGPVRVTLYATGWYRSARNEECCLYQTRISAYAGQPRIDVEHRTVITYDTQRKRLRGLGFAVKPTGAEKWRFGTDGKVQSGALPAPGKDARGRVTPAETIWLHQDKWDHFRLMQGDNTALAEGNKSDGWAAVATADATVALFARNLWELYPKEIELGRDGIVFHAWPKHGHVAFTEAEELDRRIIYKIFYAHQGKYLDLDFPQEYFDAMQGVGRALEQQDINALSAPGLGLAVSNDFCLYFAATAEPTDLPARAALYRQNPHAISDPIYNGLTEVEGRFAGYNPQRFPDLEKVLTDGYHGFTQSVDVLENYGMWIWPDTHNNWSPLSRTTEWHRWWNHAHYQDMWEDNFLYWRSGVPWLCDWARNHTRHYMDVGTVNYDDPENPVLCRMAGAMYHCKGFLPWGSPLAGERCGDDYAEVGAHFINPDAFVIRYLIFGDVRGRELADVWFRSFERAALPPERSRECNTTLGEMLSYYTNFWDPQALLYIRDLADDHNSRPWRETPSHPGHNMYHDRWVMRYWNQTRDPVIKQRILEWFTPDFGKGRGKYAYPQLRALCWEWTGDKAWLTAYAPQMVGLWSRRIYDNPDDPLYAFGARGFFFPTHSLGQMAPYYMQALVDAGVELPKDNGKASAPVKQTVSLAKDKAVGLSGGLAWLQPAGDAQIVTLTFTSYVDNRNWMLPRMPWVGSVTLLDANGEVIVDETYLPGSQRPQVVVTVDAKERPAPWRLELSGYIAWTGQAAGLVAAPTAEEAKQTAAK